MGAMSRAVCINAPGGPENVGVFERTVREPGVGEVRLAVRAAAVNPTDIGLRQRGVDGVEPPWVPGMDAAGVVESVGEGVERLAVGDEVMAAVTPRRPDGGAQAERIVVPAASVVPVPEGASFAEAATLPMNGLTALLGLQLLGLAADQTLGVTGGAGLLASYVIPLAKRHGLVVIADAKPEDESLVRSFGVDHVVARGDGFTQSVRQLVGCGVDGLFDTALLGSAAFPAVRDGGSVAVVRGWSGGDPEREIRVHEVWVSTVLQRTDWLEELRELASEGALALRVAQIHAPEHAVEAHRRIEAGGLRGRDVVVF
jgi:NADPH:quinone reductase